MARPTSPKDKPSDHDPEKPNHIIFWLDVTIGNPNEYKHLKKAFGSNTDPRCETWTMLKDKDYIHIIAESSAVPVTFGGVEFLLYAFDNETDCLNAFEEHQDKRIFFITSGSLGEKVIPKVIAQYEHVFVDRITNKPYPSIYIFCHNIEYHMHWVMDYLEYVQMFNFDSDVLERMTRDIADYFVERGKRLRQDNDLAGALQRLYWAKRLWYQYQKMQRESSRTTTTNNSTTTPTESSVASPTEISVVSPTESSVANPTESSVASPTESSVASATESSITVPTNSSTTTPTESYQPIRETKETKEIEELIEEIEKEQRNQSSDDENENNDDENRCYQSYN